MSTERQREEAPEKHVYETDADWLDGFVLSHGASFGDREAIRLHNIAEVLRATVRQEVSPLPAPTTAPAPLSAESEALLKQGMEDAKAGRIVYLGSFAQYADDDERASVAGTSPDSPRGAVTVLAEMADYVRTMPNTAERQLFELFVRRLRRSVNTPAGCADDSARLDWLEKWCRKAMKAVPGFAQASLSDGIRVFERDSLRECIDAAMSSRADGEGEKCPHCLQSRDYTSCLHGFHLFPVRATSQPGADK